MENRKMTVKEALALLEDAPDDETRSAIRPDLSTQEVLTIVVLGLAETGSKYGADYTLSDIMEKRVYQSLRNQRRPRY
jgi:hypothetical protein